MDVVCDNCSSVNYHIKYEDIYSPIDLAVASAMKSGISFCKPISEYFQNNGHTGFFNISFDKISFKDENTGNVYTLRRFPVFVDDYQGFYILPIESSNSEKNSTKDTSEDLFNSESNTNNSSSNPSKSTQCSLRVYRIKSHESVSDKIWRLTTVQNDYVGHIRPLHQYSLNMKNYEFLTSSCLSEQKKEHLRSLKETINTLYSLEVKAQTTINEYLNLNSAKIFPLIKEYAKTLSDIREIYDLRRSFVFIDTNYWAGNHADWVNLCEFLPFENINVDQLLIHLDSKKYHTKFRRTTTKILKSFFENQHNLLFESPVNYIYSAIRELEHSRYAPDKKLLNLSNLAMKYDLECASLMSFLDSMSLQIDKKTASEREINAELIKKLISFSDLKLSTLRSAQKILNDLNTHKKSNSYALARRMLCLYIARLSWADSQNDSKLFSEFMEFFKDSTITFKSAYYPLQSINAINQTTLSLSNSLMSKSFGENQKQYKQARKELLDNLEVIASKLESEGARVYAIRAREFRQKEVSHSRYKLGPQRYLASEIFSAWHILQVLLCEKTGVSDLQKQLFLELSQDLERAVSQAINAMNSLVSRDYVSNCFFVKNNPTLHYIEKSPSDIFPIHTQLNSHGDIKIGLDILIPKTDNFVQHTSSDSISSINSSSSKTQSMNLGRRIYNVVCKGDKIENFEFKTDNLRQSPAKSPPMRPNKYEFIFGPKLSYPSSLNFSEEDVKQLANYVRANKSHRGELASIAYKLPYIFGHVVSADPFRGCKLVQYASYDDNQLCVVNKLGFYPSVFQEDDGNNVSIWDVRKSTNSSLLQNMSKFVNNTAQKLLHQKETISCNNLGRGSWDDVRWPCAANILVSTEFTQFQSALCNEVISDRLNCLMSDVFAVVDKVLNRLVVEQKQKSTSKTIYAPENSCEHKPVLSQSDSKEPVSDTQSTRRAINLMKSNSSVPYTQHTKNNKIDLRQL